MASTLAQDEQRKTDGEILLENSNQAFRRIWLDLDQLFANPRRIAPLARESRINSTFIKTASAPKLHAEAQTPRTITNHAALLREIERERAKRRMSFAPLHRRNASEQTDFDKNLAILSRSRSFRDLGVGD